LNAVQSKPVSIRVEADGLTFESSGSVDEIMPQLIRFLSQIVPTYDFAKKLLYVSDLASLVDRLSEYAKIGPDGKFLLTQRDLPADRAIIIILFMAHLTEKIGKCKESSIAVEQLSETIGKASKTIRNSLAILQKTGLIKRSDRGYYRITQKGLMALENFIAHEP
jgi:predicted transcriptional regulator